jgi:hypothetical protein
MDSKNLITTTIERLQKTKTKEEILAYFKNCPDLTIKKLAGMKRSGKYTTDIYDAIIAHEIVEDGAEAGRPDPEPDPPPPTRRPVDRAPADPQRTAARPAREVEFEDDPEVPVEGTLPATFASPEDAYAIRDRSGKVATVGVQNQRQPVRIIGERQPDIRVRQSGERGGVEEGIRHIDPPITVDQRVVNAVAAELQRQGWSPPPATNIGASRGRTATEVVAEEPVTTPTLRRRARMGDNWNTPKPTRR